MASTVTIRLSSTDREVLARAARTRGTGVSGFIRQLAEAEAKRLITEAIRRESQRVVDYLATHPEAREEVELYGAAAIDDWPA